MTHLPFQVSSEILIYRLRLADWVSGGLLTRKGMSNSWRSQCQVLQERYDALEDYTIRLIESYDELAETSIWLQECLDESQQEEDRQLYNYTLDHTSSRLSCDGVFTMDRTVEA